MRSKTGSLLYSQISEQQKLVLSKESAEILRGTEGQSVGDAQVQVVDEVRAPARRADLWTQVLREGEVGMVGDVMRPGAGSAAVHLPVEERERDGEAHPHE